MTFVLLEHGFQRGSVNKTLFIKQNKKNILIAQAYVNDIVFGFTSEFLTDQFAQVVATKFEMSMVGELFLFFFFFYGLTD